MGAPDRLPDDDSDESPQKHWETYEGKVVDPRFTTNVDPRKDIRFDTHVNPSAVVRSTGPALKALLAAAGILVLALISYFLFRGSDKQSPRTPGVPSGQMQRAPVHPLSVQELLPLARMRKNEAKAPEPTIVADVH